MIDYVPLFVSVLVAGATVATVAILLRTPVRLTEARARLAELEQRVQSAEASARKAWRKVSAERKAEQEAPDDAPFLPFPSGPSAPAPNHLSVSDVQRLIHARKRGLP